jgi:cell division topological specificity factor
MVGIFERLFGRQNNTETASNSGKIAKDRLQFVLVQDRIQLPADRLQAMQREIIEVISKYVAVDMDNVDFALSNRERNGLLIAEIPFISVTPEDPTSEAKIDAANNAEPDKPDGNNDSDTGQDNSQDTSTTSDDEQEA